MSNCIYTVGHSNHPLDEFLHLLDIHSVTVLADIRSSPGSRFFTYFNQEPLRTSLKHVGIKYVFMGDSLGGRPNHPSCFEAGRVQYDRVALLPTFSEGLNRLINGAEKFRIALMCSEKDPITCHRMLLVARNLARRGVDIRHVLIDGSLETQQSAENRMMDVIGVPREHLFEQKSILLERAYALQSSNCAFALQPEAVPSAERIGS